MTTAMTAALSDRTELLPFTRELLDTRGNYLVLITPADAEFLLTLNTNNRRPSKTKLVQYVRDMAAGRWDPDASDLKVSRQVPATGEYELIDGQTRSLACLEAGVAFPTLLRTGCSLAAKAKVDTGKARIGSDVLKMMRGIVGPAAGVSAAVSLRNRYTERVERYDRQRGLDWKATTLTHDELLAYLDAHPALEKYASVGQSLYQRVTPVIQVSVWIAGLSWFAEIDEGGARDFAERLIFGEFGGPGDPLQALVGYAARIRSQVQPGAGLGGIRGRIAQEENLMALIKTWNAMRTGAELRRLSVRRDERLPLPTGEGS
jgi:hypothetical protein